MTRSMRDCYFLPGDAAESLANGSVAKLTPTLAQDDLATPVTVLDNFDNSLRQSGRLLLDTGTALELLGADGSVLTQPAKRKGQFVADLPEGTVKQALSDLTPLRSLLPIATGTLHHAVLGFVDDAQKTHCRAALQTLTSTAGETTGASVVIVTLEGLRGYDKALAALRDRVEVCGGTALNIDALYAHLFPDLIPTDTKPKVEITADHTAFEAANAIIAAYIPALRAHEAGIIADHDTEFLHDYRIALRKIRSVLSLFKGVYRADQTADLKARFSKLMAPTGRLRDLDVYLLERQKYYDLVPMTLHTGLNTMFAMFAKERKAERIKLARHLRSKHYAREIAGLEHVFTKRKKLASGPNADLGAHDYACALIWKRYRKICRVAGAIGPDTDDAEVHALRIHCKKLRYLMEFFAPVFPKPEFKSLIKPLKTLQDNLGLINDCVVQQASLQHFLRGPGKWPHGVDVEVAQSVGALTTVLHARQVEERAKTVLSFAAFNSPETQQTFRDLFHTAKGQR
ncbi:MAG: CHAD domain-containing protein [Cypionkella sp.]